MAGATYKEREMTTAVHQHGLAWPVHGTCYPYCILDGDCSAAVMALCSARVALKGQVHKIRPICDLDYARCLANNGHTETHSCRLVNFSWHSVVGLCMYAPGMLETAHPWIATSGQ